MFIVLHSHTEHHEWKRILQYYVSAWIFNGWNFLDQTVNYFFFGIELWPKGSIRKFCFYEHRSNFILVSSSNSRSSTSNSNSHGISLRSFRNIGNVSVWQCNNARCTIIWISGQWNEWNNGRVDVRFRLIRQKFHWAGTQ